MRPASDPHGAPSGRSPYLVPRYREDGDPDFYHVLHGTVPGHQIDFIYCPEVPQGPLTQTHFAHVARLLKYIEPLEKSELAFALGNLSRDDVQHEPGHGGVALIFSLRVLGVEDHAGRAMPPYAHGLVAVDRALDQAVLLDAITAFHRRFLHERPGREVGSFYRAYVRAMREDPESVSAFLRAYVSQFDDLPKPGKSTLGWDFVAPDDAPCSRITVVHRDRERFSALASVAATLASVLYRSNVKWTTISSGRGLDIAGGVSVRLIPRSEVPREPDGRVIRLEDLPADEVELAEKLFSARPRASASARRAGWRARGPADKRASRPTPEDGPRLPESTESTPPDAPRSEAPPPRDEEATPESSMAVPPRTTRTLLAGAVVTALVALVAFAGWQALHRDDPAGPQPPLFCRPLSPRALRRRPSARIRERPPTAPSPSGLASSRPGGPPPSGQASSPSSEPSPSGEPTSRPGGPPPSGQASSPSSEPSSPGLAPSKPGASGAVHSGGPAPGSGRQAPSGKGDVPARPAATRPVNPLDRNL
ncbi:MAG: hypothetical protein R3B70_34945 [Polyangiaceae bacterium]